MRSTGWRRRIECLISCITFRKRATNYTALLRKMTYKDKAFYDSTPPYIHETWLINIWDLTHQHMRDDSSTYETWLINLWDMTSLIIHTYSRGMSRIFMSHVTHINASCHTHEWVMVHMKESWHTWMNHVTHECVMSHIWMSHVTHESRGRAPSSWTYLSYIWTSHVTHEWVMSHTCHDVWLLRHGHTCPIYERVMTHMNKSHHTYVTMYGSFVMDTLVLYTNTSWHTWMRHVTHISRCRAPSSST